MAMIDGKWIHDLRLRLNLTQTEFAKELCVSQGTVARWENDDMKPMGPAKRLLEMLALRAPDPEREKISA